MLYKYYGDFYRTYSILSDTYSASTYLEMRCVDANQNESWILVSICSGDKEASAAIKRIEKETHENIEIWFEARGHKVSSIERTKQGWKIVNKQGHVFTGANREAIQQIFEIYEQSMEPSRPILSQSPVHLMPDVSDQAQKVLNNSISGNAPFQGSPGDIFEYDSLIYGKIEVEFIKLNEVENWPIQTAFVRFEDGREDSVRTSKMTPTGRLANETTTNNLRFGVDPDAKGGKSSGKKMDRKGA